MKTVEKKKNIFELLRDEILNSQLPEDEKNRRLMLLSKASKQKVNLMLVGATSVGKSSTINALFDMSVAKVGIGADPETKEITKYELDNLVIWDSPGLGDNVEADKAHKKMISKKLKEKDEDGNLLIDLVLVVLDASSKDLGVSYDVIINTLIPCLGQDNTKRILVGLNQIDMAMKGRNWDYERNEPNEILQEYINKKAESVKRRLYEAAGIVVEPICYCAGYTDGMEKQDPYNLAKLLYHILEAVPDGKRLVFTDKLNALTNWTCNDRDRDYLGEVQKSFWDSLLQDILTGIERGAYIGGCSIGIPGIFVGGLAGAVIGGLQALIVKPLSKLVSMTKVSNRYKQISVKED